MVQIQVEVEFTIQHSLEQLKNTFTRQGRFPEWRSSRALNEDGTSRLVFLEVRTIGVNLHNEDERYAWFVFSFEACGELKKRIVIPNVISSEVNIDYLNLDDFLRFCRECLIAPAQGDNVLLSASKEITDEHVGLRALLKNMLNER